MVLPAGVSGAGAGGCNAARPGFSAPGGQTGASGSLGPVALVAAGAHRRAIEDGAGSAAGCGSEKNRRVAAAAGLRQRSANHSRLGPAVVLPGSAEQLRGAGGKPLLRSPPAIARNFSDDPRAIC